MFTNVKKKYLNTDMVLKKYCKKKTCSILENLYDVPTLFLVYRQQIIGYIYCLYKK